MKLEKSKMSNHKIFWLLSVLNPKTTKKNRKIGFGQKVTQLERTQKHLDNCWITILLTKLSQFQLKKLIVKSLQTM
jgi:hypothetical protein